MIDTVVYKCFLALKHRGFWPRGWRGWRSVNGGGSVSEEDYAMQNNLLGVRVFIHADVIIKVEADLPKLLYGHNGRLLKSQEDIDVALNRLAVVLGHVSSPHGVHSGFYPGDNPNDFSSFYTRVDLVWQFDLEPKVVLLAMRNAKHPEINKRSGEYMDQTLVFPGTDIRISMYDKKAKSRASCRHNVFRVEIQLETDKISEHFRLGQDGLKTLDLSVVYGVYRDALLRFGSDLIPDPTTKGSIEDFLAWTVVKLPDDDPVSTYCLTKQIGPRSSRSLRKAVGRRVPTLVNHSWSRLLPEGFLPPAIEILAPRREQMVNETLEEIEPWSTAVAKSPSQAAGRAHQAP